MAKTKKRGLTFRVFRFSAKLLILLIAVSVIKVFAVRFINPPVTMPVIVIRVHNLFSSEDIVVPGGEWKEIRDISPHLVRAVLAAEDQRFMSHRGFDYHEMSNTVKDIIKGKRIRGASTITMQMARSVFLWKGRHMTRKLLEAYYTVLIETFMPKVRIMELYLNTVDWGTGIIGAEAASKKYFHKSASELTPEEAALMAAILPNPHSWSPVRPGRYVLSRQKSILKNMGKMHL
ncbi:MAG: monofunctional biosynthetic peptidoglycan transglycosylase [Deltaproteobacteria bacterium]|jgi:monofunctional biosynthetic peptidoglycan transglycosylase|nr:monofunctional biosynthetic peptidoglycan transglycosylase [Deltaproteobacteria bacterium]